MSDNELEVYTYRRANDHTPVPTLLVPRTVEKLIVNQGIQILPDRLCFNLKRLKQVTLPNGLKEIRNRAFAHCENILGITICNTVQAIGPRAFSDCYSLAKLEFEFSETAPNHQLRSIDRAAFSLCKSLSRVKLPSTVNSIGQSAFASCHALLQADLSNTCVTEIGRWTFACCHSMQTISLPNTLERIAGQAFVLCHDLVTVVVPLDSQPIRIGQLSFQECHSLTNLVLPKDSTAEEDSFTGCRRLLEHYGEDSSVIATGLIDRFEKFSILQTSYDHSAIQAQELRKCLTDCQQEGESLVDEFGMNPFHVFFTTIEQRIELLEVLLDLLPIQVLLKCKDANGKRPLDYLISADGSSTLIEKTLVRWMVDSTARWDVTSWTKTLQCKVQSILAENDKEQRKSLYDEAYSTLVHYENVESTSILEMALWKRKLKRGRSSEGTKRLALDREDCRFLSASDVVIPFVVRWLGIL